MGMFLGVVLPLLLIATFLLEVTGATWVGPEDRSRFLPGIPARDLSANDVDALTPNQRESLRTSGLYDLPIGESRAAGAGEVAERTYGTEKHPLGYFADLSPEERAAVHGVGPVTLAEIAERLGETDGA